jgi:hypothetical protein
MSATTDQFPRDTGGLPAAALVDLTERRRFTLRIAADDREGRCALRR